MDTAQSGCVSFRRVIGHDTGGQRGSDLTPRPGESNILQFRRPLSRFDPHVSEVEVAHNQDARFANRFAVLVRTIAGRFQFLLFRRVLSTLWNST